jgi:hypothetical protein
MLARANHASFELVTRETDAGQQVWAWERGSEPRPQFVSNRVARRLDARLARTSRSGVAGRPLCCTEDGWLERIALGPRSLRERHKAPSPSSNTSEEPVAVLRDEGPMASRSVPGVAFDEWGASVVRPALSHDAGQSTCDACFERSTPIRLAIAWDCCCFG